MIIINTHDVESFSGYIRSLSKSARKNYRYARKHNEDLEYKLIPFNKEKLEKFMELWERQLIRGKPRKWGFGVEYLEKVESLGRLRCFVAQKGAEEVSMHFVENHDGYVECHPPMYDKTLYSNRYLAKFMWFKLIKFAIESSKMDWVDIGGCGEKPWPETIKGRHEYPHNEYKWKYVPVEVKGNPDKQPKLTLERPEGVLGNIKYLKKHDQ